MSLNRYDKRRDKNEPEIVAMAEELGAKVFSLDVPFDLLISYRANLLQVEVKDPEGPADILQPSRMLTEVQRIYKDDSEARGVPFWIITTKEEIRYLLQQCRPGEPFTVINRLQFDQHFGRFLVGPNKYKSEIEASNRRRFPGRFKKPVAN